MQLIAILLMVVAVEDGPQVGLCAKKGNHIGVRVPGARPAKGGNVHYHKQVGYLTVALQLRCHLGGGLLYVFSRSIGGIQEDKHIAAFVHYIIIRLPG